MLIIDVRPDGPAQFARRHVNATALAGPGDLLQTVLTSETREIAALRLGITLGELLSVLNQTAAIERPMNFSFRGNEFELRVMRGVCDDYHSERFARFGHAITVRFYMRDEIGLPERIFEIADWNFMSAGFPRFVGYAYGSVAHETLFLSGIQSDLAARYSYLFQRRGGGTSVRYGGDVIESPSENLPDVPRAVIRLLRRTFQRNWLDTFAVGLRRVMEENSLELLGVHQFLLSEAESHAGHQMTRIYRRLPLRYGGVPLRVLAEDVVYDYLTIKLDALPTNG